MTRRHMESRVFALFLACLLGGRVSRCQDECGGVFTDPTGVVQSPGYPADYPNNVECVWFIQAFGNRGFRLRAFTQDMVFEVPRRNSKDEYTRQHIARRQRTSLSSHATGAEIQLQAMTGKTQKGTSLIAIGSDIFPLTANREATSRTPLGRPAPLRLRLAAPIMPLFDRAVQDGLGVTLVFDEVNLENSLGCSADFIHISYGDATLTLCGNPSLDPLDTGLSRINIVFKSNADGNAGHRFRISYFTDGTTGTGATTDSTSSTDRTTGDGSDSTSQSTDGTTPLPGECPSDWEAFGIDCYYFVTSAEAAATFDEAQDDCQSLGGNLASIHSQPEMDFVAGRLGQAKTWIGAMETGSGVSPENPLNFEWVDGSNVDYHNVNDIAEFSTGENGPLVIAPDRWKNRDCNDERYFICEGTMSNCLPGWSTATGYCLFVGQSRPRIFEDARDLCGSSPNADLLVIGDDEDKQTAIVSLFGLTDPTLNGSEYWVGLRSLDGGSWSWVDGSGMDVDRWESGYPAPDGGLCGVMVASTWIDSLPTERNAYVCKARSTKALPWNGGDPK
ncbi:unnamed protein product [Darwinula stevensoni]|uniref:Uncharacterized protein n=1 Tax=Darwinula stevensoni TaxID=69355 RepID=A0A7R9A4H5_9CRUS|nr:unnamed protein product [Darwinula stevensoni]CAG0883360.1 unnamed protein product [Darwinula stevensoni]